MNKNRCNPKIAAVLVVINGFYTVTGLFAARCGWLAAFRAGFAAAIGGLNGLRADGEGGQQAQSFEDLGHKTPPYNDDFGASCAGKRNVAMIVRKLDAKSWKAIPQMAFRRK